MLVRHLPRDSALFREAHGEGAEWTVTDHLLAFIADQLAEANWMFATVNRDEESEPLEYPRPVPRPGPAEAEAEEDPAPDPPGLPGLAELRSFFS
ncbi:hypothetical protein [Streptomyces sp. NBC_00659]|uniref:hypothetical protein n=1 Tax=Streptomyces sp. NBC_00659 TaxID=2903669 RepID=UPI003FCDD744